MDAQPTARTVGGGLLLAVGLTVLAAVVVHDGALSDTRLFDPRAKDELPRTMLRVIALAIGAAATMIGARRLATTHLPPRRNDRRPEIDAATTTAVAVVAAAVAGGAAVLVLVAPPALTWLAIEDRPVEWASAILAFVAGILVFGAAVARWRIRPSGGAGLVPVAALLGLSGVLVLLGLEEVSWFQRVLDIESPDRFLEGNSQQELNLHNFATSASGNAYYVGAFFFAVFAPYVLADRSLPEPLAWATDLVPAPLVVLASAPAAALSYEKWDVFWIHAMFWGSIVAVLTVADGEHRRGSAPRLLGPAVAVVMVGCLVVFATAGDRMTRSWDESEVRELVIPYGFAVHAVLVVLTTRAITTERTDAEYVRSP